MNDLHINVICSEVRHVKNIFKSHGHFLPDVDVETLLAGEEPVTTSHSLFSPSLSHHSRETLLNPAAHLAGDDTRRDLVRRHVLVCCRCLGDSVTVGGSVTASRVGTPAHAHRDRLPNR